MHDMDFRRHLEVRRVHSFFVLVFCLTLVECIVLSAVALLAPTFPQRSSEKAQTFDVIATCRCAGEVST